MKAVFIVLSLLLVFQVSLSSPAARRLSALKTFKDFIVKELESLESSKLIETLSFLAKLVPSENKLDAFTPIFKEYLQIEKEATEQNMPMFSYIMVKNHHFIRIEFNSLN